MKHASARTLPRSVDPATCTDLLDVYAEPATQLKTGSGRAASRPVLQWQVEPFWRFAHTGRHVLGDVDPRVRLTAPDGTTHDIRARDAYDLANAMILASYAALEG